MTDLFDHSIARASMGLASRTTRRSFFGRTAAVLGAVAATPAVSALLARPAAAQETDSVLCKNHPGVGSNYCPYCRGGSWIQCSTLCGTRAVRFTDCCSTCTKGCHTDAGLPSCCYTGYCGSGCSGQKVACRVYDCTQNLC